MREILSVGAKLLRGSLLPAFGHRVVHGGVRYDSPVRVTSDVLDDLARLAPLAPLHQPHNLAPIRTILNVAPQIPQVACFDTAFHRKPIISRSGIRPAAPVYRCRRSALRVSRPVL